jgi:hypothetical protein
VWRHRAQQVDRFGNTRVRQSIQNGAFGSARFDQAEVAH